MHADMLGRGEFDAAIEVRAPVDRDRMARPSRGARWPAPPRIARSASTSPRAVVATSRTRVLAPSPSGVTARVVVRMWACQLRSSPSRPGSVNGDIRRDTVAGAQLLGEVAHEASAFLGGQLVRQGDLVLAGDLGVLAPLGRLDGVPQRGAILGPGRCVRRHDEARRDPGAALVVVDHAGAFVGDEAGGAVRGSRGGAASSGPETALMLRW